MTDSTTILTERGKRYGRFIDQASVSQTIKRCVFAELRGKVLANDQFEALEMICVKLARIIHGDENYPDNWRDIEGYAKLVADRLEGDAK